MMLHLLHELPPEHPLRNLPLRAIQARYRPKGRTRWAAIDNLEVADLPYNHITCAALLFDFAAETTDETDDTCQRT